MRLLHCWLCSLGWGLFCKAVDFGDVVLTAVSCYSISVRLEVHLVGGFNDDRQLSQKLTNQLLSKFAFFPLSCPTKKKFCQALGTLGSLFVCNLLTEGNVDSC